MNTISRKGAKALSIAKIFTLLACLYRKPLRISRNEKPKQKQKPPFDKLRAYLNPDRSSSTYTPLPYVPITNFLSRG